MDKKTQGFSDHSPVALDAADDTELTALGDEMEAANTEVKTACALGDLPEDFLFADSEVAHKIIAVPARTVAGLKIKVRALSFKAPKIIGIAPNHGSTKTQRQVSSCL